MLKGLANCEIGTKKGMLKLKDIKRSYQQELLCVSRQIRWLKTTFMWGTWDGGSFYFTIGQKKLWYWK